ncbi:hypothetical protein [Microterricola pindariensis]|nr:hypothetical protein [Microterricola pindariensis]
MDLQGNVTAGTGDGHLQSGGGQADLGRALRAAGGTVCGVAVLAETRLRNPPAETRGTFG